MHTCSGEELFPALKLYHVYQSPNNMSIQGLHRIGKHDIPVYDGSWTEWEAQPDSDYPKVTAIASSWWISVYSSLDYSQEDISVWQRSQLYYGEAYRDWKHPYASAPMLYCASTGRGMHLPENKMYCCKYRVQYTVTYDWWCKIIITRRILSETDAKSLHYFSIFINNVYNWQYKLPCWKQCN